MKKIEYCKIYSSMFFLQMQKIKVNKKGEENVKLSRAIYK